MPLRSWAVFWRHSVLTHSWGQTKQCSVYQNHVDTWQPCWLHEYRWNSYCLNFTTSTTCWKLFKKIVIRKWFILTYTVKQTIIVNRQEWRDEIPCSHSWSPQCSGHGLKSSHLCPWLWPWRPIPWHLYAICNSHYVLINFCTVFDTLTMTGGLD